MTLTLELTPAEEEQLRREASRRGQEMTDYARTVLLPADDSGPPAPGESLADAFAGRIGRIDGTTEALSEETGRRFTEYLVEKQRQGRL